MRPAVIEEATAADDLALRALLSRNPMPGAVELTFEREPDFFAGCAISGADTRTLLARTEEGVVALACRSTRNVYVNGNPQRLGYLGQLRIDPEQQGRWLVSRGFAEVHRMQQQDPVAAYLVAIVDNNELATGVLVRKRRPTFPTLTPVAGIRTCALSLRWNCPALSTELTVTPLTASEKPELITFLNEAAATRQFAPVWTESCLDRLVPLGLRLSDILLARKGDKLVGAAALWDQSHLKQTVVRLYHGWLRYAVPFLGMPRPGQRLREAYVSLLAIGNDDTGTFRVLLRHLYREARERRLHYLLLGLDVRDPLLRVALEGKPIVYSSKLYLAQWPGSPTVTPDSRLAYADIATY